MNTIRLRPHHLLCILTYAGAGYTRAFVRNFDVVARLVESGRGVELVSGPDSICEGLRGPKAGHCMSMDVQRRDRAAQRELRKMRLLPAVTQPLSARWFGRMREAFAEGHIRSACASCGWRSVCDAHVRSDYEACAVGVRRFDGVRRSRAAD